MFLDYIGMAKLDDELITRLVAGMADYLEDCNINDSVHHLRQWRGAQEFAQ